jgi:hypothetical protein
MQNLICGECDSEYRMREKGATRGPGAFACVVCGQEIFLWTVEDSYDYEIELVKNGNHPPMQHR